MRDEKRIPADRPEATEGLIARHSARLGPLEGLEGVARYGGPREELVRFGKDLDQLIVGSRGYGRLDRLVHGSVSRYLVRHATCPLLVLPRHRRRYRIARGRPTGARGRLTQEQPPMAARDDGIWTRTRAGFPAESSIAYGASRAPLRS